MLEKPWIRNAATHISDSTACDNFIAIGDAAASFDPVSSMGIGFAISSACHAARLIQTQLTENTPTKTDIYQQDILANFNNYMKIRSQFYQKETRWASADFWKRRNELSTLN